MCEKSSLGVISAYYRLMMSCWNVMLNNWFIQYCLNGMCTPSPTPEACSNGKLHYHLPFSEWQSPSVHHWNIASKNQISASDELPAVSTLYMPLESPKVLCAEQHFPWFSDVHVTDQVIMIMNTWITLMHNVDQDISHSCIAFLMLSVLHFNIKICFGFFFFNLTIYLKIQTFYYFILFSGLWIHSVIVLISINVFSLSYDIDQQVAVVSFVVTIISQRTNPIKSLHVE